MIGSASRAGNYCIKLDYVENMLEVNVVTFGENTIVIDIFEHDGQILEGGSYEAVRLYRERNVLVPLARVEFIQAQALGLSECDEWGPEELM